MNNHETLINNLTTTFGDSLLEIHHKYDEITIEVSKESLKKICLILKDDKNFAFNELMDVCGVDYLTYGQSDWQTESASESGFSRGVELQKPNAYVWNKPRFAVVYHLLSLTLNQRIRIKVFLEDNINMILPSVHDIWKSANWFEREAYDLFGILFDGHPDLRRILTDYGFIGFPFRKDFPMIGNVEMRYDATLQKVVYGPVEIEPRINVPKVIREDNRYIDLQGDKA